MTDDFPNFPFGGICFHVPGGSFQFLKFKIFTSLLLFNGFLSPTLRPQSLGTDVGGTVPRCSLGEPEVCFQERVYDVQGVITLPILGGSHNTHVW